MISALSVLKNTCDTLSLNLFTLDLIILSAVPTREFYSLAYITEHLSDKKKKSKCFLYFRNSKSAWNCLVLETDFHVHYWSQLREFKEES